MPQARAKMEEQGRRNPGTGGRNPGSTVDSDEADRFEALAETWWDPEGPFRPLHRFNPTRIRYLRDSIARQFDRDIRTPRPLEGLTILDVGCGGGLLSEPLARMGATVTGLDVVERNVAIARLHAEQSRLDIEYLSDPAEDLAAQGRTFDAVLAMEVVEHVADVDVFLAAIADMTKPGGMTVVATLNRTLKSLALAKIGAEYVLRWLPRGTHDWRKFLKPSEVALPLRRGGLHVDEVKGVSYVPLVDEWRLSDDPSVNYMVRASR